jgi:hypothetical protein
LKVVGLAEQLISSAAGKNIKEAQLSKLLKITADSCLINLFFFLLAIEDLDLSRNLISNWDTVFVIVSQLPQLKILRMK